MASRTRDEHGGGVSGSMLRQGWPEPPGQQAVPQLRALKVSGRPSLAGQPEPRDPDLEVGFPFALKLVPIAPISIKE